MTGHEVKKTSSPFLVLLVSLLVLLMAGQALASSFVLCLGENGHSAIEQAVSGKCATDESTSCASGELCTHHHCRPCQDISTELDFVHGRWQDADDLSLSALPPATVSIAPPVFFHDLTVNLSSLPPPRPYQALFALRTVVLLS